MVKVIASIYDAKAEAWMTPMFFLSKAQAMRSFSDAVNDGKSDFSNHPGDYTLFVLGTFDERSGEVLPVATPESLGLGINFKHGELAL